jgi:hypothetical protein
MAPPTHDRGVSDLSPAGTELRFGPVSFAGMNVDVGGRSQPPRSKASVKGCLHLQIRRPTPADGADDRGGVSGL